MGKYKKLKKEIFEGLYESTQITDTRIDKIYDKIESLEEKIKHIDERTMALDNVKLNNWIGHTKQLEDKIKILMDRTTINYTKMSEKEITYQECVSLINYMRDRGATKGEINYIKKLLNKYTFRCRLFKEDEDTTPEEIIDGKKEE